MAKYILSDNFNETPVVRVFKNKDDLIYHLIYNVIGDFSLEVVK